MGSRLFVAIGSTAIRGMEILVRRCKAEGIYETSGDVFVGIDSDVPVIQPLEMMDDDRSRICCIQVRIESESPTRKLFQQFQPRWNWSSSIPVAGVGGDRRLCLAVPGWEFEKPLQRALAKLGAGSEVVLIASAFGATSTGLYLNLAHWLRKNLPAHRMAQDDISFYSIVVLPGAPNMASSVSYPTGRNLCAFLKDIQAWEWCKRLCESPGAGFKVPAPWEYAGGNAIPLWNEKLFGTSSSTHLPVDRIFFVPTEPGGHAFIPETIAEVAFTLAHLGLWRDAVSSRGVNLFCCTLGVKSDNEDFAFGCLSFVAARSGRTSLLRRWVYERLNARWRAFISTDATGDDRVQAWLMALLDSAQRPAALIQKIRAATDRFRIALDQMDLDRLSSRLADELDMLRLNLSDHGYDWPSFDQFLQLVADSDKPIPEELSLESLSLAYSRKIEDIRQAAADTRTCRQGMLDAVQAGRKISLRRRQSTVAVLFGLRDAATREVREQLDVALSNLCARYIDCCLSEGTLARLPQAMNVKTQYHDRVSCGCRALEHCIDAQLVGKTSRLPNFICEESEANRDLSWAQLEEVDFNRALLKAVLAGDRQSAADVLAAFELDTVRGLKDLASRMGAANPLASVPTVLPADRVKPSSSVFAVPSASLYRFPFYIQRGPCTPLTWDNVITDLGLKSFMAASHGNRRADFDPRVLGSGLGAGPGYALVANPSPDARGLWLGTAVLDFSLGELIERAYGGPSADHWQRDAARDTANGGANPNLLSLRAAVYLGCVLGVIEKRAQTVGSASGPAVQANVKVRIGKQGAVPAVLERSISLADCFANSSNGELHMNALPVDWVRPLLSWIDGSFEADLQVNRKDGLGGWLRMEDNILTSVRLGVEPKIVDAIAQLARDLEAFIGVTREGQPETDQPTVEEENVRITRPADETRMQETAQDSASGDYNVFISAKNLDDAGHPTEDRKIAEALWEFLTGLGFRVFFSNVSLERMGESGYTRAIDDALDRAQVLVVACTSAAYVDSKWVRYEWDSFLNDIKSGIKPNGHVFVYLVGESIRNLPRGLRHTQCIEHGDDGFDRLARFIGNAIGRQPVTEGTQQPHGTGPRPVIGPTLAGVWDGEWKRDAGRILHRGRLSITQTGQRLTAQMRVTFEKQGRASVVHESLRGVITPRCVVLQGESAEYQERGAATSYLLDHFELMLDQTGATLAGDFYSKKGRGKASFRRSMSPSSGMSPT